MSASRILPHSFSINYSGDRKYGLVAGWLVLIVSHLGDGLPGMTTRDYLDTLIGGKDPS